MRLIKILLIGLLFAATPAAAQEQHNTTEKMPPFVRATGEAVVMAKPDRALVDIGVVTQAETAPAAVAENARQLEAALARIRAVVGPRGDVKTISFMVSPNYRYPKEGGEPTLTGYTATNLLRVTLDDLAQVGKVIDAATQAGANRVENLRFTLRDEQAVQLQALREAAVKARRKAEALAFALGGKIKRLLSVVESSPNVVPLYDVGIARTEAAATPIEPGTIEIRASVVYTAEVTND